MTGDPVGLDTGADGLAELVAHYAHALAIAPSAAGLMARKWPGEPRSGLR